MDPLITNGVDPALLRIVERHGRDQDSETRRKRSPAAPGNLEEGEQEQDSDAELPQHKLDDHA